MIGDRVWDDDLLTPGQDRQASFLAARRDMGGTTMYGPIVSRDYAYVPQNLMAANKPSETNVINQLAGFQVTQVPPLNAQTGLATKLLSKYTLLPLSPARLATFGST